MCFPYWTSCALEPLPLRLAGAMWCVWMIVLIFFVSLFLSFRFIGFLAGFLFPCFVLVVLSLVAVLISGLLNPVAMPRQLGEIGIIALFFALLLVMLIYLMHGPYGRWILGLLRPRQSRSGSG